MSALKVFACGDCGKKIVIMATNTGSVLPVEVKPGDAFTDDDIFKSDKHSSHLMNCSKLQSRWNTVKKSFVKNIFDSSFKSLHR